MFPFYLQLPHTGANKTGFIKLRSYILESSGNILVSTSNTHSAGISMLSELVHMHTFQDVVIVWPALLYAYRM